MRNQVDAVTSYDAVAAEYVQRIFHELDHKPFDRQLLDRFAAEVQGLGPAADIGCGPGHVARYLHDRGVRVCGIDLSAQMVQHAWRLNPGIEFLKGNMMALEVPDGAWAGIVAFYSIIHVPRNQVVAALRELKRALQPGGILLLAFHIGDQVLHLDEWWERKVCLDFVFFQSDEMATYLQTAGFTVEEVLEREPYAQDVEHQSRRSYILARAPRSAATD